MQDAFFYLVTMGAFNSTSRYQEDIINIDTQYFDQMVGQIYP